MSSSLPGKRELPTSPYNMHTYWGRVRHSADISDPRTLLVSSERLENAKQLVTKYKRGEIKHMNADLWHAKKIVDSTLHPDTGEPVLLPFRMSCFVLSNLVVTAGMLTPGLGNVGTVAWQVANQSLNVGINYSNSNKSSPLSTTVILQSYVLAVSASCSVALGLKALVPRLKNLSPTLRTTMTRLVPFAAVASAGALNVFLMRSPELKRGIDVFPATSHEEEDGQAESDAPSSLGKSKVAARRAVTETALSRVFNSTPVMAVPPLILLRLQQNWSWLRERPRAVLPVNLGLILGTSLFALPFALGVFPQQRTVNADQLEDWVPQELAKRGFRADTQVEFNRGI